MTDVRPALRRPWLLGGVAAAVLSFVAAAWLAASLPSPPPAGISDPGAITRWGIPVVTIVRDLGAAAVVGLLLASRSDRRALAASTRLALVAGARRAAWITAVALVALYAFTASDVYSVDLATAVSKGHLLDLYEQTDLGRRLAQQVTCWTLVGILLMGMPTRWRHGTAAGVAMLALVPWAYGGHAAGSGTHLLSVLSVLAHLVGATVWVGGVIALAWVARHDRVDLLPAMRRFSPLATVAFAAVLASGVVAAWTRLPDLGALVSTGYGLLIVAKSMLLLGLGVLGHRHRQATQRSLEEQLAPLRFTVIRSLGLEVLLMTVTMGVAVALSRTSLG